MELDAVNVLVVDDSPELAYAIGALLESMGYTVRTSLDAVAALAMIESQQPHCVLLDVLMPGMDGLTFAKLLRRRYRDDIVLIGISGHPETAAVVAETFKIVDHYLQKPIDEDDLAKILPDLT